MAFPTSGYGGTLQTSPYPKAALNKTLYNKRFLERAIEDRVFYELAQKKKIGHGKFKGDTQQFTQMLPKAAVTSALTEATVPTDSDFTVQTISVTLQEWGDFVKASSMYSYATFDENFAELHDVLGQQASDTLELRSRKVFSQKGCELMRVDSDPAYQQFNIAILTVTSTTVIATSDLTGFGDAFWIGAQVTITEGPGYGMTRTISAYTSATGAFTVSAAFDTIPTSASKFSISLPTGLTATDKISFAGIKKACRQLEINKYRPFESMWKRSVLSPYTKSDLMEDDKFEKLAIYHQSGKDAYFKGEVFDLLGVRWGQSTINYRCAAATPATYSATGEIEIVPILGANCFGEIETTKSAVEVWYTEPKIAEPAMQMYSYLSWKHLGVDAPLNATWGIGLACGFTA
jgi:N4-gp56 family major capsid protein